MNSLQARKVARGHGFIAALDQSGGSAPKTLRDYGVTDSSYDSETEMFDLMHAMRSRIIKSHRFDGDRIFGTILFEQTMSRSIDGIGSAEYLWEKKKIVPFLKVDRGLSSPFNGVQLMKPIDGLDELLDRAKAYPIFGTKMRSVIHRADALGIEASLDQQFEYAKRILSAGFMPIIEPEIDVNSPEKAAAEMLLKEGVEQRLRGLGQGQQVMLKLSIPSVDGFFSDLIENPRVLRVVALSGGYDRDQASQLLSKNFGLVASFSRALTQGLSVDQSAEAFDEALDRAIETIYHASTVKIA